MGTAVAVGLGVAVGGTAVAVGGTGVGVAVGGTGVAVAVGGTGVAVGGTGVGVAASLPVTSTLKTQFARKVLVAGLAASAPAIRTSTIALSNEGVD